MSLPTPPPPDVLYTERVHVPQVARPSWSANPGYLDEGHRTVYAETKDVPGWQMEGDAYKLYELARFAGDVILDLGAYGGRSAVVELKGALGRADRTFAPQVYSLDLDTEAIRRSLSTLESFGLAQHVLLFQGPVDAFFQTHDVGPSMVFVDADHRYEGVRRDLDTLSAVLAPGVPVLCHDYLNRENDSGEIGVRRAATEWEETGAVRFVGAFGAAALFVTTDQCTGTIRRLPDDVFARRREAALITYGLAPPFGAAERALLARLQAAELELVHARSSMSPRRGAGAGAPAERVAVAVVPPAPPDITHQARREAQPSGTPSWRGHDGYVDAGHRTVFAETKDILGWQAEGDAHKLYEMAHFAGDVILDVGTFGGRSAVVELKGALGRPGARPPQLYTLDVERGAVHRSHEQLQALGLDAYVLLYQGNLASFFENFEIGPTMVFLDADHVYEGVRRDMDVLSRYLASGVPVLCHDYLNVENDTGEYGVRRAALEWEESGHVRFLGAFGCSAFFVTTERCTGPLRRLADDEFARRRDACLVAYGLDPASDAAAEEATGARVRELEDELAHVRSTRAYRLARRLNSWVTALLPTKPAR